MLKSKITKRKFYNKWLYKVTLRISAIYVLKGDHSAAVAKIRHKLLMQRKIHCDLKEDDAPTLLMLSSYLESLDKSRWAKRIEYNSMDIYTNEQEIFDKLSDMFSPWIQHRFEPKDNMDMLTANSTHNHVIVKQLPHGKFKYKAFLLPHLLPRDLPAKQSLLDWMSKQPKIHISESVKTWFLNHNFNWDRRYMYIEDEPTLLMVKLRAGSVLGRVHEYTVNDK